MAGGDQGMSSYILCQTMASYMEVAPNTAITFDLYGKLSGISGKFKELWNKSKEESPEMAHEGYTTNNTSEFYAANEEPMQNKMEDTVATGKVKFCGQCGAKNTEGTAFCGSCGAKM